MAEEAADKAIAALNGTMVGGRALNINEARPKADRAGSESQGGFLGGRSGTHRW